VPASAAVGRGFSSLAASGSKLLTEAAKEREGATASALSGEAALMKALPSQHRARRRSSEATPAICQAAAPSARIRWRPCRAGT
jgi:hypothetical protein